MVDKERIMNLDNSYQNNRVYIVTLMGALLASLVVAVLFLLVYKTENTNVRKYSLSNFVIGNNEEITYNIEPEIVVAGNTQMISGWVTENNKYYEYFNYGIDLTRISAYNNVRLALIKDESVFVLPTRVEKDDELRDILNDNVNREWSKFISLLPETYSKTYKEYGMGFVIMDYEGKETLYIIK